MVKRKVSRMEMNGSFESPNLRGVVKMLLMLMSLVPVAACSGIVEREWSEEVVLDDGRIIIVERHVKFDESNALGGGAYSSTELESRLKFAEELADLPAWNVPLLPIVLYLDQSTVEWVIVATTTNCDTWFARGSPKPPYWEYRLRRGQWEKTDLSPQSLGRKANLFFDYLRSQPNRRVSSDFKAHWISTHDFIKDVLSVDSSVKVNCMQR